LIDRFLREKDGFRGESEVGFGLQSDLLESILSAECAEDAVIEQDQVIEGGVRDVGVELRRESEWKVLLEEGPENEIDWLQQGNKGVRGKDGLDYRDFLQFAYDSSYARK
jgi:hypothetical protein